MPKIRFFYEKPFTENEVISISEDEYHHLVNVMRAKIHDNIEIVNGMGELALAIVQTIEKREATLLIAQVKREAPHDYQIILAQGIPRPNRLDFILEKGTELGMTEIWLFACAHSERKDFSENQLTRMRTILISAMKQCGRLYLPKIILKPPLAKWESLQYTAFFGDVEESASAFIEAYKKLGEGVLFFIGPESGFSDAETKQLQSLKARGVKLNHNILRTDTAAITALAIIGAY